MTRNFSNIFRYHFGPFGLKLPPRNQRRTAPLCQQEHMVTLVWGRGYKTAGNSISLLGGPPFSPCFAIMSRSLARINSVWEFGQRRASFGRKAQVAAQLASSH